MYSTMHTLYSVQKPEVLVEKSICCAHMAGKSGRRSIAMLLSQCCCRNVAVAISYNCRNQSRSASCTAHL